MAGAEFEPSAYRIIWRDPNKMKEEEILTGDCKVCDNQKTDETKLPVVAFRPTERIFYPKDYLEVELTTVSEDTVVTASSYGRIPITIKNERTNNKYPAYLSISNQPYKLTEDASMLFKAGIRKRAWYYQCPDGMSFVLGHAMPFTSRILIAPYDDT